MLFQIKFGIVANLEYPNFAALVDPLFGFAGKRVGKKQNFCHLEREILYTLQIRSVGCIRFLFRPNTHAHPSSIEMTISSQKK